MYETKCDTVAILMMEEEVDSYHKVMKNTKKMACPWHPRGRGRAFFFLVSVAKSGDTETLLVLRGPGVSNWLIQRCFATSASFWATIDSSCRPSSSAVYSQGAYTMVFASGGLISCPQDYIPVDPVLRLDRLLSPEISPSSWMSWQLYLVMILEKTWECYSLLQQWCGRALGCSCYSVQSGSVAVTLHSFSRPYGYVLVIRHVTRAFLSYANNFWSA